MRADPPAPGALHRFAHLDTLRAGSALLVVWAHLAERFRPFARNPEAGSFLADAPRLLNFGRLGVPLLAWVALTPNAAWRGWPLGVYMGVVLALTVVVSTAVYYTVERPAIALGKRLAARAES